MLQKFWFQILFFLQNQSRMLYAVLVMVGVHVAIWCNYGPAIAQKCAPLFYMVGVLTQAGANFFRKESEIIWGVPLLYLSTYYFALQFLVRLIYRLIYFDFGVDTVFVLISSLIMIYLCIRYMEMYCGEHEQDFIKFCELKNPKCKNFI